MPARVTTGSDGKAQVSLYNQPPITDEEIAVILDRLRDAFPNMRENFFSLLSERVIENDFTAQRLFDAVNNVIDNFQYKELNVADIIRYDRKARAYTYAEACEMVTRGEATFDDFKVIEDGGQVYRVLKIDLINKNR